VQPLIFDLPEAFAFSARAATKLSRTVSSDSWHSCETCVASTLQGKNAPGQQSPKSAARQEPERGTMYANAARSMRRDHRRLQEAFGISGDGQRRMQTCERTQIEGARI